VNKNDLIAEVAAKSGFEVVLRSRKQESADAMVAALEKSLARQVERGKLEQATADEVRARVTATDHLGALVDCDLVIESVVEDLAVKKPLFAELDSVVKDSAILATNTSTLPVVDMAVATERPDRVCGVHFFNPAPAMALVEIVRPLTASDETIAAVTEFASACGKNPVQVKDQAGFIVNALLFPYLNNAVRLLENGTATAEDIDTAMKLGCGYPMGPIELTGYVGLDTTLFILQGWVKTYPNEPAFKIPALLEKKVKEGKLGRKTGEGFYKWEGDKKS